MSCPSPYRFRPVNGDDLPLIGRWLAEPHVAEWWGGDIAKSPAEIEETMASNNVWPMIVESEGRPVAYLQSYDPHLEEGHPYQDQPKGTIGLDISIGPADLVGKGHGTAMIRQFVGEDFARGVRRFVIDPHPANARAIRAYGKAGFRYTDTRDSIYGPAHMMVLDPQEETDFK